MKKSLIFALIFISLIIVSFGGVVKGAQSIGTDCDTYTDFSLCIDNGCSWQDNTCWNGACGDFSGSQSECEYHFICCYNPPSGSETMGHCITAEFGGCGKTFACYYIEQDTDEDGYAASGSPQIQSTKPCGDVGLVSRSGDCDDNNPFIYPGNSENCTNEIDDNCNGRTDCGDPGCSLDPACQGTPPPEGNLDLYWTSDYSGNNKINSFISDDTETIYFVVENYTFNNINDLKFNVWDKETTPIQDKELEKDITAMLQGTKLVMNFTIDKSSLENIVGVKNSYDLYFIINDTGTITNRSDDGAFPYGIVSISFNTGSGTGTTSSGLCDSVTICSDYTDEENCTQDLCSANNTIANSCSFPNHAQCNWTGSECISQCIYINESTNEEIGYCNYHTSTSGDCSNSQLLTYSWTAEWINADTQSSFTEPSCTGGERTIACPAQTKLPLTSLFGIILTIIIIGFGYVLFNKKK